MDKESEKKNTKSILRSMEYNKNAVTYHAANYYKRKKVGVIDTCLASIGGSKRRVPNLWFPFHEIEVKLYLEVIKMRKKSRKVFST